MCTHRSADRWFRWWERYTFTVLGVFAVAETVGMLKDGPDAAYTAYWRRVAGQLEPCRHSFLGRSLIVTFCAWVALHFGWGLFGFAPRKFTRSTPDRSPSCPL